MKTKLLFFFLLCNLFLFFSSCSNLEKSGESDMDSYIDELMAKMTLEEKLGQINLATGNGIVTGLAKNDNLGGLIKKNMIGGILNVKGLANNIYELQRLAIDSTRLGIPLLVGCDVIHGYETTFPIPLAMSCSWDTAAVRQMARISAIEASADGINWTYSPMVDICRDARWGRIAEGNGEDPYLSTLLTKAYVHGYQGDNLRNNNEIMACLKHFALYGASESGRDYNNVDMSKVTMYNYYMPPYKAAVEAGVGSVMSSFNVVDQIPATANKWLLTDVLREQWGFKGFVVTDYNSIKEMTSHGVAPLKEASVMAINAGTDMDMVSSGFVNTLKESLDEGKVSMKVIDTACRRVLEAKYKLGLFENPYKYCDSLRAKNEIFTTENRKVARDIATETFVLLKNDNNILPLKGNEKIALIGPMADAVNNMCGSWSVSCQTSKHVSLLQAFNSRTDKNFKVSYSKGSNVYYDEAVEKPAVGKRKIERVDGGKALAEAIRIANSSDIVIAAVGESAEMSGESSSRTNLEIPDAQKDLLKALAKTGKPVVLVLFTGRPLQLKWENENIPAILNVWFAGSEAGDAILDVLSGDKTPCGKLTTSFPRSVGQMPLYYNHLNTGRPDSDPKVFNRFNSNYIDECNEPLYPFGYGLSYTKFTYGKMELSSTKLEKGGSIKVKVNVTNSGDYDGTEIVQLYIHDIFAEIARPVKELKKFERVQLKKGESRDVEFTITEEDLKYYNPELKYIYNPGEFDVMVGANSADVQTMRFVAE